MKPCVIVIGGGAAGFFGALNCASHNPKLQVILLERSTTLLQKVSVSGGGRCNVTHACFDPKQLITHYPRGSRELLGPFYQWQPEHTIAWFQDRSVPLKTESDGRMFPTTDSSQTIIDCLKQEARKLGIEIRTKSRVEHITKTPDGKWQLPLGKAEKSSCDKLLISTGGLKHTPLTQALITLGHKLSTPVPSLFTFNIKDKRIQDLAGISVPQTHIRVKETKLTAEGPLLITHWGLSGPSILKLSAWGARQLHDCNYNFEIEIDWLPHLSRDAIMHQLKRQRTTNKKRSHTALFKLPQRLWERLIRHAGIDPQLTWPHVPVEAFKALEKELKSCQFHVQGKSTNKEEFVTCGGIALDQVCFKSMESKISPGIYFAGEVLDIDGITGGFNFQAAWTTSYLAGKHIAETLA